MPQLDKFTFFPVVFWLIVIIFLLYNFIVLGGLPKIYKILLYRKKKMEYYSNIRENRAEEQFFLLRRHKKHLMEHGNKLNQSISSIGLTADVSMEATKELILRDINLMKDWLGGADLGIYNIQVSDFLDMNKSTVDTGVEEPVIINEKHNNLFKDDV